MNALESNYFWARAYGGTLVHAWRKEGEGYFDWKAVCNKKLAMTSHTWRSGREKCPKCLKAINTKDPK